MLSRSTHREGLAFTRPVESAQISQDMEDLGTALLRQTSFKVASSLTPRQIRFYGYVQ